MSSKIYVEDGTKIRSIISPKATMEQICSVNVEDVLMIITESNDYTKKKEQIQNVSNDAIDYDQFESKKESVTETLDFKNHWNRNWRKANAEATKLVKQMLHDNEQGIIIVAYGTSEWTDIKDDSSSSFIQLIKNENIIKKQFRTYWLYAIKRELIILDSVNIDGNVYIVNCKFQYKENTKITTQVFVTSNVIVDQHLKESFSVIPWDIKIHHNIPLHLQYLEDKDEEYTSKKLFDTSIIYLKNYLKISINNFGLNHPYVAISYNLIGLTYNKKGQHDKAIELFGKALQIISNIFGMNCSFIAQLYGNIAKTYADKKEYNKSIEFLEKALTIQLSIFGNLHNDIANSYYDLAYIYEKKEENNKAIEFFEKTLQIRLKIFDINNNDVAISYFALGNVYHNTNQYNKAIEFLEKSLQIRLHLFGINHSDVADTYLNLGCSYDDNGQYDKAIEFHKKALQIKKLIFGNINNDIKDILWNLGCIYRTMQENKIAYSYFEESWKVSSAIVGEWAEETLEARRMLKYLSKRINE
ncbi:hypothetical protein RFI_06414 [Reticulomyxa filosa]|uniref:Uncharacterized protein n=1 Tax=Reticulomyxa filosa TaxID=46433 RepID=X6NXU3_RETFI|nr:hypothetical protein RFI_06414 [Reticulomyxa filosa]|eukprot:ETO30703.1 hypothetical protein RFI_06414 [Reticulomyxa filosa]